MSTRVRRIRLTQFALLLAAVVLLRHPHATIAATAPTPRDLVISEINYNPRGSDDYEFIELANLSTNVLDLSGVWLTNGVSPVSSSFRFPNGSILSTGALVLVVRSTNAFAARYQTSSSPWYWTNLTVAGQWTGTNLANAGSTVSLIGSNGTMLCSVPYQSAGDWPDRADGRGSSLELHVFPATTNTDVEARAILANPRSWSSSSLYHGSPGRWDTFTKVVRINEVLAHTDAPGGDWVELVNVSDQPANLTDTYLTDNIDKPQRYAFTNGPTLQPGQMLVLSETQLGFAFSELGDNISLLTTSGTNIIRFLDTVDFPAVAREETFGLYTRTDGEHDFTELRANTPGTSNSLPRVGPVVISEIMFNPSTGRAQFIELTSVTNGPTPLYDPLHPTNTWYISGVSDYHFLTGTVLQPGATLIVCGSAVDPVTFRAQYGLGTNVAVIGPWGGNLDPDGETIQLMSPGDPEPTNGFVPYYRVDHVSFRTNAPWPAKTLGASLERIPLQAYGNDAAYWQNSSQNGTPGTPRPNRPPSVQFTGPTNVNELTPVTLNVAAVDPDSPWQTASLTQLQVPPGSSFDPGTGELQWTPSEAQGPGLFAAAFSAQDNPAFGAARVTNTVSITVAEVNQPPAWPALPEVRVPATAARSFQVTAADSDLPVQTVFYTASGLPSGFTINTNTGVISGSKETQGSFNVTVIATDNYQFPLSSTNQFMLQIVEPLVLGIQSQSNQCLLSCPGTAGGTYRVEFTKTLTSTNWQLLLQTNQAPTTMITFVLPAPATTTNLFYRLRWEP